MVFSSILFLVYFLPAFLLCYFLVPARFKNLVILAGSIGFYAWGAPRFVAVILGSILLDYLLAQYIHKAEGVRKRWYLVVSVCINVGILLYFKYANFFVENLNGFLSSVHMQPIPWLEVALPIGISFFTFHELSYIIDVYRGVKPPMKKLGDYAVYILLFPQLIAGPIIRYHEIADQIIERKHLINLDHIYTGFFRFVIGLSKKVLIANVLGEYADSTFTGHLEYLHTWSVWCAALAYTFQIYFDFSGYSDMAIGLARMMGFIFPENFNNPYIAQSITGFWQRWHMSLSRWMRDYLYIPLGGNRVSAPRLYFNLWVVFLISGLWHGAEWSFIAWGAYHGTFLVLDRLVLLRLTSHIGKPVRILFTFLVVVVGWVLFRAPDLRSAIFLVERMFVVTPFEPVLALSLKFVAVLVIAAVICFMAVFPKVESFQEKILFIPPGAGRSLAMGMVSFVLLFLCISDLMGSSFNPFIYFRF